MSGEKTEAEKIDGYYRAHLEANSPQKRVWLRQEAARRGEQALEAAAAMRASYVLDEAP